MRRLLHAWLIAIACVAAIGAGGALLMRAELVTPGPTFSGTVYSRALPLHALAMLGVFIAAFVAMPTLVLRPGRHAGLLGAIAFSVWAAVMVFFAIVAFTPDDWFLGSPYTPTQLRIAARGLALCAGVAVAQLAVSLPANKEHRLRMIAAGGAMLALVITGIPLARGTLPTMIPLIFASTLAVAALVPSLLGTTTEWIVWRAVVPCLAATWGTYWFINRNDEVYTHDTTVMLAPFPVLGAAVVTALFAAAVREREIRHRVAKVGAAMVTGGAVMTTTAFIALGASGMPRRYWQYAEEVQSFHLLAGAAALVTVAGAIAAVWSMRTAK